MLCQTGGDQWLSLMRQRPHLLSSKRLFMGHRGLSIAENRQLRIRRMLPKPCIRHPIAKPHHSLHL